LPLLIGLACKVCLQRLSRFHFRRHVFYFLPLATILENPHYSIFVHIYKVLPPSPFVFPLPLVLTPNTTCFSFLSFIFKDYILHK
jgi:hypothetical protein